MKFKIPLFALNYDVEEERAVVETIKSRWISTGPKTEEFEQKFSKMLGVNYSIALSNCTTALHLALRLLNVKEGDEVICPSLTFVATCNAIRYVGANPIFADIEGLDRPVISPADIEAKITKKTKAIMVMHYAGFPCDMDAIKEIARRNNIKVIEDACHGPFSEYKNKKLGTIGDIGCFSFYSNKNISTGEGGMLVTNNPQIAKCAKLLRSHGMTTISYERSQSKENKYDVVDFGYNYRMDDIRASIGLIQLKKILPDLKKRQKIRQVYINILKDDKKFTIPFLEHSEFSSNYIFPIVLNGGNANKRNLIRKKLSEAGIQTSMHYPAVHRFSCYEKYYTNLPQTDLMVASMITLPMHSQLEEEDIQYISDNLNT